VGPASGGRSESVVPDITFTQVVHHFDVALFGRILSLDLLQLIVSYQESFLGEAVPSEKKGCNITTHVLTNTYEKSTTHRTSGSRIVMKFGIHVSPITNTMSLFLLLKYRMLKITPSRVKKVHA
jgi:hypothetical protein